MGITRDVAGHNRHGAAFDWLLSVADLQEDAAFSHFPDCDRIFTLIEGGDVTLTLDDTFPMPCRLLTPACFPGDRPTFCTMGDGPARAFNVFTTRDRCRAQVAVSTIAAQHALHTSMRTAAIFCVNGSLDVDGQRLCAGDTAVGTGAARVLAVGAAAVALFVEVESLTAG